MLCAAITLKIGREALLLTAHRVSGESVMGADGTPWAPFRFTIAHGSRRWSACLLHTEVPTAADLVAHLGFFFELAARGAVLLACGAQDGYALPEDHAAVEAAYAAWDLGISTYVLTDRNLAATPFVIDTAAAEALHAGEHTT